MAGILSSAMGMKGWIMVGQSVVDMGISAVTTYMQADWFYRTNFVVCAIL